MTHRPILWAGSAREDLRAFPESARRRAGHELDLLQQGLEPHDFKPMPSIGAGVYELRIRAGGAFRVFYVAKFAEGLYVVHAFQKMELTRFRGRPTRPTFWAEVAHGVEQEGRPA